MNNYSDAFFQQVVRTQEKISQSIQENDRERQGQEQERVEREKLGNIYNAEQVKYAKRSYRLTIYIAIITSLMAIPVAVQFVQWIAELFETAK